MAASATRASSPRRAGWGCAAPLTAKKVFDEARRGDRKARRVVAAEAHRIALAIAAVASVLDPELVILGGGIGGNGDLLLEPVERELATLSPFRPRIEVSTLQRGGDAPRRGVDGAAGRAGPAVRTGRGVRMIPKDARDRRPRCRNEADQGQWLRSRRRETDMKRWLIAMATFALVAAACTAGGGDDTPSAVDTGQRRFPCSRSR